MASPIFKRILDGIIILANDIDMIRNIYENQKLFSCQVLFFATASLERFTLSIALSPIFIAILT